MESRMKMKKKVTIVHFQKRWKRRTSTGAVTFFLFLVMFSLGVQSCSNLFKRKISMNICHKLHRLQTQHGLENRGLRGKAKMTSLSGPCIMPLGAFWSSSWKGSWQQRQQSAQCHVWFVCEVLRVSLGGSMMQHCCHCSFVLVGRSKQTCLADDAYKWTIFAKHVAWTSIDKVHSADADF